MRVFVVWIICLFVFATPLKAARSLVINSDKMSLSDDEEMLINSSLSGFATDEAIFVKGAFYSDGSGNYFGLTKVGDTWVKNSATTPSQNQVKIGEWDGKVNVKSDYSDSGFMGSGNYKLKVGFYYTTSGGNLSPINWSDNVLTVSLKAPDPTQVPSPTPLKTVSPSITKTPTPIPTKSSLPSALLTPQAKLILSSPIPTSYSEVLGLQSSPDTNSENGTATKSGLLKNKIPITAIVLIGLGVIFIASSMYMAIQTQKTTSSLK